jgi:hypothetical protein
MADIDLGPAVVNLSGVRSGDRNLFSLVLRASGQPMDLTGYTIAAEARVTAEDTTALDAVCTITDATAGKVDVRWPGADVETWLAGNVDQKGVWDLEIDDGSGADPWTIIEGTFMAEQDITHA